MKILKETKERVPETFIANFISNGWSTIGLLKDDIKAIHASFSGTKKVEEILNDLVNEYTIAVARMTKIMEDKDYLDFDAEALEKADKKGLSEDLDINVNIDKVDEIELEVKPDNLDIEEPATTAIEPDIAEAEILADTDNDFLIFDEKDFDDIPGETEELDKEPIKKVDCDDWLCDFDEPDPNEKRITDEELDKLYQKGI